MNKNILSLTIEELKALVISYGDNSYRAVQIFGWLSKGVSFFEDMRNIPASLIDALIEDGWYIGLPEVIGSQISADGTVKVIFGLYDGAEVESVFMKYSYGNSICISSQVGCRMGCSFCASTMDGLERGLSGGEMLGEVLSMRNYIGEDINHVVIMGMGEPFDNYDEVSRFIRLISDSKGYNLSIRNITVSTCGIIPKIRRFADDFPQVNLAISLHAPNQELREKAMPVAKKYGYHELMHACREYTDATRRRITFEYALIAGINDSRKCAEELASNLKGMLAHVNLIPLNEIEGREYRQSGGDSIRRFRDILEKKGVAVTVRRTLGSDIDAACGQLRRKRAGSQCGK